MILINSKIHKMSILIQKEIVNMNRQKIVTELETRAKDPLPFLQINLEYYILKKRNIK